MAGGTREDDETSQGSARAGVEALAAECSAARRRIGRRADARIARTNRAPFRPAAGVIHGAALNWSDVDKESPRLPLRTASDILIQAPDCSCLGDSCGARAIFASSSFALSPSRADLHAYAASNIFVDAGAESHSRDTLTLGARQLDLEPRRRGEEKQALRSRLRNCGFPAQGAEAFTVSLDAAGVAVGVSTSDLQTRLDQWVTPSSATVPEAGKKVEASELHARPELPIPYVAPENELEQEVADIWQELLGIRQVGIHDNFFDLGGHSLLATMVISRLRKSFGAELQLHDIFESPTVSGLSLVLAQRVIEQHDKQNVARLLEELPGAELSASPTSL